MRLALRYAFGPAQTQGRFVGRPGAAPRGRQADAKRTARRFFLGGGRACFGSHSALGPAAPFCAVSFPGPSLGRAKRWTQGRDMPGISVRKLFQDNQKKLNLAWSAGTSGADNRIETEGDRPVSALVGHLNLIHPNKVQVIGLLEHKFVSRIESGEDSKNSLDDLFRLKCSLIIVANDLPVPSLLRNYCHAYNVPLLTSRYESPYLMDVLRIYLQRVLAEATVMHGVFLDVFGLGVLIVGPSGMGKSELALELISRGHRLVADDAVEIYRTLPEELEGRCPPVLRDFLEVRGLGILNIRAIYGETAVRPSKSLKLIIKLADDRDTYLQSLDRLSIQTENYEILNVQIRQITIPVAIGRNLSVLVEAAVQNYILQARGVNSIDEFLERHSQAMREDNPDDEDNFD